MVRGESDLIDERVETFVAAEEDDTKRIDVFIANYLDYSRSRIKKEIENGSVTVNGECISKTSHKVSIGDLVKIKLEYAKEPILEPVDLNLEIIFEDEHLLVINKPYGISVHPGNGNDHLATIVHGLLHHCGEDFRDIGDLQRPGIVHRLDKDTSGVMLVAKTAKSHEHLSRQFHDRVIKKEYFAIVPGDFTGKPVSGNIKTGFARDLRDRKKYSVFPEDRGKIAETGYHIVWQNHFVSGIRLFPQTGRTHQLRVHCLKVLGKAILFDPIYANPQRQLKTLERKGLNVSADFQKLCLCASKIEFLHPATNETVIFSADLPEHMSHWERSLKL